jgi:lipoate-protein ligase A
MYFLDLTLDSCAENLALDEALLLEAEAGQAGEVLRLWEWPRPTVVLGSGCSLVQDVDIDACRADGVPILRRSSGGGTVLLGSGCLCFSLVLAFARDEQLTEVRPSYHHILGRLLDGLGIGELAIAGISDLAWATTKISGNAQQRKRQHLLHHGTILYTFDLALVGRYLRMPARQPDYRAGRNHDAFLINLDRSRDWLRYRLRTVWQADEERPSWPGDEVRRLVEEKYARREWIERR